MSDHSNDNVEHRNGPVGTAATATKGGDILLGDSSTDAAVFVRLHQLFQRLDEISKTEMPSARCEESRAYFLIV